MNAGEVGSSAGRPYRSALRRARAETIRAAVRDAAAALFVREGYLRTTMKAIAAEAGTSVETVHAQGGKAALLLACVDRALGGDDDVPLTDRAEFAAALTQPSAAAAIEAFVRAMARAARAGGLLVAFEDAASADAPTASCGPPPNGTAVPTSTGSSGRSSPRPAAPRLQRRHRDRRAVADRHPAHRAHRPADPGLVRGPAGRVLTPPPRTGRPHRDRPTVAHLRVPFGRVAARRAGGHGRRGVPWAQPGGSAGPVVPPLRGGRRGARTRLRVPDDARRVPTRPAATPRPGATTSSPSTEAPACRTRTRSRCCPCGRCARGTAGSSPSTATCDRRCRPISTRSTVSSLHRHRRTRPSARQGRVRARERDRRPALSARS